MRVTWFDGNSWLLEVAGCRVLLDPWLVGNLVFGNAPWFFKGVRSPLEDWPDVDVVLLSQGLPDHAHRETLEVLDKSIPVVGSPNGADVARSLGFESVTALAHGESWTFRGLQIQAFPGAPIGPFLTENAYVLTSLETRHSLYYEPHGFHSEDLKAIAPVDVVLVPLVNLELPVVGPFIQGGDRALEVIQWLRPQVVMPTTTAAEIEYQGVLNQFLSETGSMQGFRETLQQAAPDIQLMTPAPGQPVEINLKPHPVETPA